VVVGKSGELFDVKEWENSETFRLGSQSNLLIRDNQTRNFENMTHGTKKVHQALTWGSELVSDKPDITLGQSLRHIENTSTPVNSGKKYRISVVIPSHNRNELVDQALFSIISQSYPFIEVIVFDNASKLPLSESSRYSKNKAIKFHRSDVFLSVTESWNRAISYATGEYLIFLGDDDGLLPGFFKTINNLIVNFDCPDFIVSSLYQFFHPEVLPSHPQGLLSFMEIAPCMGQNATPYLVSPDNAKNFVLSSLNLQRLFLFQMPGYVVRREFLLEHRSQERIFEPPFPDYFLTNFIFWKAKKIVANPNPISFQGVSKKSFGYTLVNGITQNGFKTLNESVSNDKSRVSELLLPGSQYWNSYLLTMEKLASCLEISFKLDSIKRYRKIRIVQEIVEIQSTISRRKLGQLYFEFKIRANFFNNLTRKEHLFTALAFGVLGLKKIKKFKISNISELFLLKWSPNYYVLEQFPIKSSELLDNKDLFVFLRDSL
jgi:glycosyltransferase involved in cell wall biosynthesis